MVYTPPAFGGLDVPVDGLAEPVESVHDDGVDDEPLPANQIHGLVVSPDPGNGLMANALPPRVVVSRVTFGSGLSPLRFSQLADLVSRGAGACYFLSCRYSGRLTSQQPAFRLWTQLFWRACISSPSGWWAFLSGVYEEHCLSSSGRVVHVD